MRRFVLVILCACAAWAQTTLQPARKVTDPGVVTTRQTITPAGAQSTFQGRVYGLTFGANSSEIWVLNARQVFRFDWRANRVLARILLKADPGPQSIWYDPAASRALVGAALPEGQEDRKPEIRLLGVSGSSVETAVPKLGSYQAGALAVSDKPDPQGRRIAVLPLTYDNRLAILDLSKNELVASAPTGIAPFGAAINEDGTVAYVSNWGGRLPRPGDRTAPTGLEPDADHVVVDDRGVAATGSLTRVDLTTANATHTIPVGLHPTALAWDEQRARLYVANGNSDSISVIDTRENRVIETIELQPFATRATGIAPTALALSADGETLYAACGGINAVAVVNALTGQLGGLIPTAWFPNGLALSPDGRYLGISTLLGAGSGWKGEPRKRFVHANRGSIAVVAVPDKPQLASLTAAAAENNRLTFGAPKNRAGKPRQTGLAAPLAVPQRSGDPSPIKHVVFIIKENRTYDQVLGDLGKGNSDPSLVMFGRDVSPNHHRLAEQFVLLDNFYASGGNSADGHQWVTQANETDYCLWPGYAGRSYPFDGTDPIAYSSGGFLWDSALRMKKAVRIYGEYAGRMLNARASGRMPLLERWKAGESFAAEWSVKAPIEKVNGLLAKNYPTYSTAIPDVIRARIFLADLKRWDEEGSMPDLTLLALPSDHTYGATPGVSTAKAMVADNDLALGQIVEGLTRSSFWKDMAIFIVEDDAQDGVDHVDGHRTVALVASPYARRGHIDSTFYSHQSILKTIELMLGLPTLSLFDLIANDMRASFQETPDLSGYTAITPQQSLFDVNPQVQALRGAERRAALDSMKMRWDVPDAAPTQRLNRILWHQVRGWKTPYPATRQAVFAPLAIDLDDDER